MKNRNILPLFLIGSVIALGQEICVGDDVIKSRRGLNALAWDLYWSTGSVLAIPQEIEVLNFESENVQGACFGTIDRCILFAVSSQDSSMQPLARDVSPRKEKTPLARAEAFISQCVRSFHGKVALLPAGSKPKEESGTFRGGSRIVKVPIASEGAAVASESRPIRYHACKIKGMLIGWSPPPKHPKLPKSLESITSIFQQFYLNRKNLESEKQTIRITIPWFSELDHTLYVLVEGDGEPKITVCARNFAGTWSVQRGFTDQFDRAGFQALKQKILELEVKTLVSN